MVKKQMLVFSSVIPSIYGWVDPEVLGIPSRVTLEFLKSLCEEHLLTPKSKYEEEYILETPGADERVYYLNLVGNLRWMWMYDVLISMFDVRVPFTYFQFTILERTGTTPSQLHPNSWAMIRGFEIIYEYLDVPTFTMRSFTFSPLLNPVVAV